VRELNRRQNLYLRSLLDLAVGLDDLEELIEAGEREGVCREVDGDEPSGKNIYKVVEEVGVRDAVDGGVAGNDEEENVGYVSDPVSQSS
jgi:hypothetical protein